MKTFTSGELARRAGVNIETIRYYERSGMLAASERRSSGYRVFTENDVKRLQFIRSAKALGFTLREIRELMRMIEDSSTQCHDMKDVAIEKVAEVDRKIAELNEIRQQLQSLVDRKCAESIHPVACRTRPALTQIDIRT